MSKDKVIDLKTTDPQGYRLLELTHELFGVNPLGKELLELLKSRYLHRSCSDVNLPDWYAYFRDGENNVIRAFIAAIQHFNHLKRAKK